MINIDYDIVRVILSGFVVGAVLFQLFFNEGNFS